MLQGMYSAPTGKFVIENFAIFKALKVESQNTKKELEDLRKEARSTFLSQSVLIAADNRNTLATPNLPPMRPKPQTSMLEVTESHI